MTTYKNLCGFLTDELSELDKRATNKQLSNAELEYGDKVAALAYHLKKLEKENDESSMWGYYDNEPRAYDNGSRRSYRGGRSYNGGRSMRDRGYSENSEMRTLIEDMMKKAPDEHTRREMENLLFKIEEMG